MQSGQRSGRVWFGALLLGLTPTAACDTFADELPGDVFLMSHRRQVAPVPADIGGSCQPLVADGDLAGSSDGNFGNGEDFWFNEVSFPGGLLVVAGSGPDEMERRFYSGAFAAAGVVDRFVITTHAGVQVEFTYWGGGECELEPPAK